MTYICPINGEKINEPTVRTVAGIVVLLAILGIYFLSALIFSFLAYDFFVRGFWKREYSLLRLLAMKITLWLNFKMHLINAAPKQFAAKIGFAFSVSITALLFFNQTAIAYVVAGILIICAVLESVFAYCLGCEFYSIYYSFLARFDKNNKVD